MVLLTNLNKVTMTVLRSRHYLEEVSESQPRSRAGSCKKKQEEIREFIRANPSEIESGRLVVLFLDECHLCWGDVCGYGWGRCDMGRDSYCK